MCPIFIQHHFIRNSGVQSCKGRLSSYISHGNTSQQHEQPAKAITHPVSAKQRGHSLLRVPKGRAALGTDAELTWQCFHRHFPAHYCSSQVKYANGHQGYQHGCSQMHPLLCFPLASLTEAVADFLRTSLWFKSVMSSHAHKLLFIPCTVELQPLSGRGVDTTQHNCMQNQSTCIASLKFRGKKHHFRRYPV